MTCAFVIPISNLFKFFLFVSSHEVQPLRIMTSANIIITFFIFTFFQNKMASNSLELSLIHMVAIIPQRHENTILTSHFLHLHISKLSGFFEGGLPSYFLIYVHRRYTSVLSPSISQYFIFVGHIFPSTNVNAKISLSMLLSRFSLFLAIDSNFWWSISMLGFR